MGAERGHLDMGNLSDTKLRALKPGEKRYQVADGEGLYVEVLPGGTKSFRYGYRLFGKKEKVVLGSYPALSLARARQTHRQYQTMVEHGESPARHQQKEKDTRRAEYLGVNSLQAYGEHWFADWRMGKSEHAVKQAEAWLTADLYAVIGPRPISQVEERDLVEVLDRIKKRGAPQTARRVLGYMKGIFRYAKRRGAVRYDPAQSITADEIAPKSQRDRALEPHEICQFVRALDATSAAEASRLALKLILLTLCRKDELRLAKWEHVDLVKREWLVPRTKSGKPHVVYLSSQAERIFRRLRDLAGESTFVLPHRDRSSKPMGHMTLNKNIENLLQGQLKGMAHFTVHDLRRTASTRLHEQGFAPDVVEKALGHHIRGVRGVYNRAEYAEQRREMLQFWANYLDQQANDGKVVFPPFPRAA